MKTGLPDARFDRPSQAIGVEGVLVSVQIGLPRTIGDADADEPMDQVWTTGTFKEPVAGPVWLGRTNLAGDGQADLKNHGGPDKAVNVYPIEHYEYWTAELPHVNLPRGGFGENFTTSGLLEGIVCVGDVFEVGEALVQVSQPRQPCWKQARRWRIKDLALRIQESGRTGWYLRVLREGLVGEGLRMRLVDRAHPEWTVADANAVMHVRRDDLVAAARLAACPALSASWRATLGKRADTGHAATTQERLRGH